LIIEHGAECFLAEKKVLGSAKNVAKKPKEVLIEAYEDLFKTGAFKGSELDKVIEKIEKVEIKKEEKKEDEDKTVYMRMTTIKKGKGETKPMKGQKVGCYYKGHFDNPDGKIFDQLQPKSRGSQPLSFKAGNGRVIRGWDEAIMQMTVGQTAGIYIQAPWAYGKKGYPDAGIPPNQDLYFEVTLDRIG